MLSLSLIENRPSTSTSLRFVMPKCFLQCHANDTKILERCLNWDVPKHRKLAECGDSAAALRPNFFELANVRLQARFLEA
jgi:hypothetical protein